MSSSALSPRAFQGVVLALLVAGIVLVLFQQRRIGQLEAKVVAAYASATSVPASPPPVRGSREAPRFVPVPSAAPGTVVMSGLTKEEAFAMTERLRLPPPPEGKVNLPAFLAEHRIGPALWKKVQATNARASEALHALNRAFPSGSIEESEARLDTIDRERKAAVSQLLTPEQAKAYEAMRTTGHAEGIIRLADGAVTRWVYQY